MYNKHLWHDVNVGILHDFCSRPGTIDIVIEIFQRDFSSLLFTEKIFGQADHLHTNFGGANHWSLSNSIVVFCFPVLSPPIALTHRIS